MQGTAAFRGPKLATARFVAVAAAAEGLEREKCGWWWG